MLRHAQVPFDRLATAHGGPRPCPCRTYPDTDSRPARVGVGSRESAQVLRRRRRLRATRAARSQASSGRRSRRKTSPRALRAPSSRRARRRFLCRISNWSCRSWKCGVLTRDASAYLPVPTYALNGPSNLSMTRTTWPWPRSTSIDRNDGSLALMRLSTPNARASRSASRSASSSRRYTFTTFVARVACSYANPCFPAAMKAPHSEVPHVASFLSSFFARSARNAARLPASATSAAVPITSGSGSTVRYARSGSVLSSRAPKSRALPVFAHPLDDLVVQLDRENHGASDGGPVLLGDRAHELLERLGLLVDDRAVRPFLFLVEPISEKLARASAGLGLGTDSHELDIGDTARWRGQPRLTRLSRLPRLPGMSATRTTRTARRTRRTRKAPTAFFPSFPSVGTTPTPTLCPLTLPCATPRRRGRA